MLFSINYSTQALVLFTQDRLKTDRFKCPDWPDLIAEAGHFCLPAVHFNLNAGKGKLTFKKLEEAEELANRCQTPFINLHLDVKTNDFPEIPVQTVIPEHQQKILHRMLKDVEKVVKRFGSERVIVENVPYRQNGQTLRPSAEPELISKIVEETGCGFLFDIPHARISAQSMGLNEQDYISRLPVDQLKELHFTGVVNLDGWLQDHMPAQAADWATLDWVLSKILNSEWPKPWMLAFEYGGVGGKFSWRSSARMIEEQGNRLYRLVKDV